MMYGGVWYGWKTEVEGAGAAEGETQYAAAAAVRWYELEGVGLK